MTSNSSTATMNHHFTDYSLRPWNQVVRGQPDSVTSRSPSPSPEQNVVFSDQLAATEALTVETDLDGSEGSSNGNVKKSAWNKPSQNGVIEGSNTPVMGAVSWPALSELNRPVPKTLSFSTDSSSKPTSDRSKSVSQAPVVSQPPQKQAKSAASYHSNQNNHTHPLRQRPMKRNAVAGGGYNRPLPPPPPPIPPYPLYNRSYSSFVPPGLDSTGREQSPYTGFVARPMSDQSNRKRNNFGPRPHLNNGYVGRRDHLDRDWHGGPRSHTAMPHQMVSTPPPPPRGYMQRAHLGPASFIAPQPMRPYGTPMGYEMVAPFYYIPTLPSEPYMGGPFLPHAAPPPSIFIPALDQSLPVMILNQIEYYFSDANLVKDNFLKSNMDEEGWVPISLIAGFRRVQSLTSDVQMILKSLKESNVVEVEGDKVRRRNEWRKWVTLEVGSK